MQEKAILVLVNPKSGGGLAGELAPYLMRELSAGGLPVEAFQSSGPGQITAKVASLENEYRAVIVIGGDGTVREAIRGEPGPDLPIAVLPAGTANVLACELRLPKSPRDCAAMVLTGKSIVVDVGRLRQELDGEIQEDLFTLFVGAGPDGRIVHEVHEKRDGGTLGKLKYLGPITKAIFRHEAIPHYFVLEDGTRHGPFEQALVTNVRAYGGFWKLPGEIRMDDGLFDAIGIRARSGFELLKQGIRGSMNRLAVGPDVFHHQGAKLRIEAESRSPLQVDGDPCAHCPIDIEVVPKALRLLIPG